MDGDAEMVLLNCSSLMISCSVAMMGGDVGVSVVAGLRSYGVD